MRGIFAFLLLVVLSLGLSMPAGAQIFRGKDSVRQAQKAAKKNQKGLNKAAKKYRKAQRKAAKRARRRG